MQTKIEIAFSILHMRKKYYRNPDGQPTSEFLIKLTCNILLGVTSLFV